jgi:hypothetical protein
VTALRKSPAYDAFSSVSFPIAFFDPFPFWNKENNKRAELSQGSKFGPERDRPIEQLFRDQEVEGSNPFAPTIFFNDLHATSGFSATQL